jgi:hypothetical protein
MDKGEEATDKEESCEEKPEEKKEKLNCLVAKTALIIPFSFGSHKTPPGILQQRLLDRTIVGPTGPFPFLLSLLSFTFIYFHFHFRFHLLLI